MSTATLPFPDESRARLREIARAVEMHDRICADLIRNEAQYTLHSLEHRVARANVLLDLAAHDPPGPQRHALEEAIRALLRTDIEPVLCGGADGVVTDPIPLRLLLAALPPSLLFLERPFHGGLGPQSVPALLRIDAYRVSGRPSVLGRTTPAPTRNLFVTMMPETQGESDGVLVFVEHLDPITRTQRDVLLTMAGDDPRVCRTGTTRRVMQRLHEKSLAVPYGADAFKLTDAGWSRAIAEGWGPSSTAGRSS